MKYIFNLITLIFLSLLFSSCSTTIYLVRHAEKQNMTDTSTLTTLGQQRAIALSDSLVHASIESIYATKYIRTQLTAQPLATALHKNIQIYSLDSLEAFSNQLKNLKGKKVLVVGHTTNIPKIINYISGEVVQIQENDFDNFFEIKIVRFMSSKIELMKKTYGIVSP